MPEEYRIERNPIYGTGIKPIFDGFKSKIFPTLPEDVQEEINMQRKSFQRLEGIIEDTAARKYFLGKEEFNDPKDEWKFRSDLRRVDNVRRHLEAKYGLLQEAKEYYQRKVRGLIKWMETY